MHETSTLSDLNDCSTDTDNVDTCINSFHIFAVHHKHDYSPAVREGSFTHQLFAKEQIVGMALCVYTSLFDVSSVRIRLMYWQ